MSEDESLEVTTTLIFFVKTSIRPRLNDNLVVIGDVEFGNCLLEFGVSLADVDKDLEFFAIKGVRLDVCKKCNTQTYSVNAA